jgi:Zn-dependent M28 family amino/carboxypeptidase
MFLNSCRVALLLVLLAPQTSPRVDKDQLLTDLKVLSSDKMQGRQVDTPGSELARSFIVERFRESGIEPFGESYLAPFTFLSGRGGNRADRHGVNVIGRITGTARPDRYIVISAHYDHLGVRNGQTFYGADDNASGTAALFAIGKYFSSHRPETSLIFAAFDAEETGLQGSQSFLKQPPVDLHAIALNINIDMIARDHTLYVVGTYLQPFLKPTVERIIGKASVKTVIGHDDPAQKNVEDWTRDSDHYSFIQAKIPALYFGVEDFSQHHKATDAFETIDRDFYVNSVDTMVQAVMEFEADIDRLPVR